MQTPYLDFAVQMTFNPPLHLTARLTLPPSWRTVEHIRRSSSCVYQETVGKPHSGPNVKQTLPLSHIRRRIPGY